MNLLFQLVSITRHLCFYTRLLDNVHLHVPCMCLSIQVVDLLVVLAIGASRGSRL
jgi:hypothetical protein